MPGVWHHGCCCQACACCKDGQPDASVTLMGLMCDVAPAAGGTYTYTSHTHHTAGEGSEDYCCEFTWTNGSFTLLVRTKCVDGGTATAEIRDTTQLWGGNITGSLAVDGDGFVSSTGFLLTGQPGCDAYVVIG